MITKEEIEEVKNIQYERRLARERVVELEARINKMRGFLAPLKTLIWQ